MNLHPLLRDFKWFKKPINHLRGHMVFENWSEFFQMGRHGLYVWSAYGISIFTIVAVVFMSRYRFARWKNKMLRQAAREVRLKDQPSTDRSQHE